MTTTYTPRADSLPGHVVAFFLDNPDETLTLDDIVTKWDAIRNNVHTLLGRAITERLLVRDRNAEGEYCYSAGPYLGKAKVEQDQPRKAKGYVSARLHFDIDSLKVDEGIPFTAGAKKGQGKWEPLFDKLAKVGQSAAIPAEIRKAVGAAAVKRNKEKRGTFRVQLISANEARVWRIA